MKVSRIFGVRDKYLLIIFDILLISSAFILAQALQLHLNSNFNQKLFLRELDWFTIAAIGGFPVVFYIFELYEQERWRRNTRLFFFITAAVLCGSAFWAVSSHFLRPGASLERLTFGICIVYSIFALFASRKILLRISARKNKSHNNILLIGNDLLLKDIFRILQKQDASRDVSVTHVEECAEETGQHAVCDAMTGTSVYSILQNNEFSTVVVSTDLMKFPVLKQKLIDLRFAGVKVYDTPDFYEALTTRVAVNHVRDSWFLFRNQGTSFNPRMYLKMKKIIEKIISLVMIIGLGPLMLLIAAMIKCSSSGPVLFRQQRLSKHGKEFTLYKFRTMVGNAAAENVPVWLKKDDSRITGIGGILRKTRIDELPQLYNVLRGDMSFTGPRPIRRQAADLLAKQIPYYRLRFMVKPGLTGWAQVRAGYGHTIEEQLEKLEYDLYYIQNQSAVLDLFIMLKTVQTVIFGKGR